MDILFLFGVLLGCYIVIRLSLKEPIIPWKEKSPTQQPKLSKRKEKQKKHHIEIDQEPDAFRELFKDIKEIDNHMIRYHHNRFVMIAEVEPVNYFLLSQHEQEAIDVTFERWLAQINYNVAFYLQNRFIDLADPIEIMRNNMVEANDLSDNAFQYGRSLLEELNKWQKVSPRYETKRYLIFTYDVNTKEITADDEEELEQKITDKAFAELYRRYNTAKSSLRRARMNVQLLTNEGIGEVLYHAFNRRKAVKNRYYDFAKHEVNSMYVTADQDDVRVELVKEGLKDETIQQEEKAS